MLRDEVIKKALSYVGRKGWTMRSNWCARFVHDVMNEVGAGLFFYEGKKCDSCTKLRDYYLTYFPEKCDTNLANCKPGDLVLFQFDKDSNADHIGFFERRTESKKFKTVEGNTRLDDNGTQSDGGYCANRTRKMSQVMLFVHLDYKNPFPKPTRTLKKLCKGSDVKWLQFILKNIGYDIEVDGSFGKKTENAVLVYQQINHLTVDGKVGANTRRCLEGESYGN